MGAHPVNTNLDARSSRENYCLRRELKKEKRNWRGRRCRDLASRNGELASVNDGGGGSFVVAPSFCSSLIVGENVAKRAGHCETQSCFPVATFCTCIFASRRGDARISAKHACMRAHPFGAC